jgi:hypothetical protein
MERQIKAVATQYFPIGYPHVTDILHGMAWLWFLIFAMLLITDGYYFLVFIGLGFGLGRFYFQQANPTQLRLNTERTVREQEIKVS